MPFAYLTKGFRGVIFCLSMTALLPGCFGWVELPPVTARAAVASGAAFGPTPERPAGTAFSKAAMVEGLTCNLPGRGEMEEMVRANAPGFAGGLIHLRHAYLDEVVVIATQGDFAFLTALNLFYVTVGGNGLEMAYLGGAGAAEGFGGAITITPWDRVDLLDLMEGQLCGAVVVVADGVSPETEVIFDAEAVLTVHAEVGF